MEYYVYMSKHCNLSCRYCCGKDIKKEHEGIADEIHVERIVSVVKKDMSSHSDQVHTIVFYGGEPLLNQEGIKHFLEHMREHRNLQYYLYTNGILLDQIDVNILDSLKYILISIDGEQEVHDKNRGIGNFYKVLENSQKIRRFFRGETIARITLTLEGSLYDSVTEMLKYFDHVYWQLESSPQLTGLEEFTTRYKADSRRLIDYWIQNMEKGVVKSIVPFQICIDAMLDDYRHENLRCGSGSTLRVIDNDGKRYLCDELLGDPNFCLDMTDVMNGDPRACERFHSYCENCDILQHCAGRCLVSLRQYPEEKFLFYCENTKTLISELERALPAVRKYISEGLVRLSDIETEAADCTEEIP